MDCTDIIIGSARGMKHRIGDYYTRDRSTPRLDSFWGGKESLTAAMGFERDGVTTILFRRKLTTDGHFSDHEIFDGSMQVWETYLPSHNPRETFYDPNDCPVIRSFGPRDKSRINTFTCPRAESNTARSVSRTFTSPTSSSTTDTSLRGAFRPSTFSVSVWRGKSYQAADFSLFLENIF